MVAAVVPVPASEVAATALEVEDIRIYTNCSALDRNSEASFLFF